MEDDLSLLRSFISTRDEQAFAALARRYVDLVYSAARRQVRDDAAAQDVTQQVFIILADKARTIREREALAGWLLATTRYVALNALRTEARRRRHEREAAVMQQNQRESETTAAAWAQVGPMLDEAVAKLKPEDRDALALRYFQGRSVADVAAALGVSPEAAQKRVTRAVERLRELFARRGVRTSADALSSALMANALIVAPAALGTSVAGTALTAASGMAGGAAGGSTKGALAIMAAAKTKLAAASVAAAVLVGFTGTLAYQQFRTPGGKSRQVRVDPAAAALPAVAPRQTIDATAPWRQRFDEVYMLAPGEALKRVAPPFIPERLQFYLATVGRAAEVIPRGADAIILTHDASGVRGRRWQFGRPFNVEEVLRNVVEISPQDVDLPPAAKNLELPGDFVYRPAATPEQRMAAFARVLSSATGRT